MHSLKTLMGKRLRAREIGIEIGKMKTGRLNAITDIKGVGVGHSTIIRKKGARIRGHR
ncbi:MAG: hypothetical protein QXU95_02870 [Candidatus Bathyarchaeia archaeon]